MTGAPPKVDRVQVCYMQMDDEDEPPAGMDLVFRVKRETYATRVNGVRVCPVETGREFPEGKKPTCTKCKLCFRPLVQLTRSPEGILATV